MKKDTLADFIQDEVSDSPIGFSQIRVIQGEASQWDEVVKTFQEVSPDVKILNQENYQTKFFKNDIQLAAKTDQVILLLPKATEFQELFEYLTAWRDSVEAREKEETDPAAYFRLFIFISTNLSDTFYNEIRQFADVTYNLTK